MRRFDVAVNWPEIHANYTRRLLHLKFNIRFISIASSYLHVAVWKKRAAVLKLFNRSQKRKKKTRRNSASRVSRFSDSRFLCCHLVEIEDVITPRKITLFKYKSWTEQRIRCRQKCRYFEDICFSFRRRTQINNKCGKVTLEGR